MRRGGALVLRDVRLDLAQGEALVVTGPNGAGKSTLLRALAGLLPLSAGSLDLRDGAGATLDEPVGMLGDLTPRHAVKTAAGRRKAAEWLKHLENQSAHRPPDDPLATYSFLWLWEELGIADLRQ